MMVTVSGNTHHKTFHVARSQFVGSRWMYELKDPVTNSSWEEGKLFPGNDLENDQIAIGQPITNHPQQLEVTTSWHSQPSISFSLQEYRLSPLLRVARAFSF
ncbi:hypothetical protein GT037_001126 [Alternaria burnsii]|uniref:Uncharacterized protein n=1 Tax=Alternaria burnsii TaxID=1187904 RepID=A0A8H7EL48_9PLEO|nr:uncharacterized protein GT037_001126 [Alternaria burnsii]KAF7682150.1 hypothetical protein GT037_001126 [Alternaria burnsii]